MPAVLPVTLVPHVFIARVVLFIPEPTNETPSVRSPKSVPSPVDAIVT